MAASTSTAIELPPINIQTVQFMLVGDTPLIVHAWSEKAKRQMLDKQMKKATKGREAKDPEADYEACFYRTESGGYGFPTIGVKGAMISACRFLPAMKMTEARGAFHIDGNMLDILGEPRPREDMVRVGMTTDIRYRPEFPTWRMPVTVRFNAGVISAEQLANLLNIAGFGVGIGEWRPEKSGSMGMFHVATSEESAA